MWCPLDMSECLFSFKTLWPHIVLLWRKALPPAMGLSELDEALSIWASAWHLVWFSFLRFSELLFVYLFCFQSSPSRLILACSLNYGSVRVPLASSEAPGPSGLPQLAHQRKVRHVWKAWISSTTLFWAEKKKIWKKSSCKLINWCIKAWVIKAQQSLICFYVITDTW